MSRGPCALTISPVELAVVGGVAGRRLRRALEGRLRQRRRQGTVAVVCGRERGKRSDGS